uniref:Uncharacterized protein n=1 Tax=Opuntia streptacantha TaxID=393608 RepID=A0A7C9DZD9_OPUST
MELRYLAFSSSYCFLKAAAFARLMDNGCFGLKLVAVSPEIPLCSSFLSISISEFNSLCNLFSSLSHFFFRLRSCSCCMSIDLITNRKLSMASDTTCSGNLSRARCHSLQRLRTLDGQ